MESAPAGKYQSNSGIVIDQPLFIDSENGSAAEVPTGTQAIQSKSQKQKASESVGILLEAAPTNKYKNKPESTIVDVPLFLDDSAGTAGGVPLSPYIIFEVDLDPGPNGVSFQDATSYVQLGMDKKIGNGWTLGASAQQSVNIDGINGSQDWNNSGQQTTRLRLQAGYGTSFGLVNIIRVDQLIWTGGQFAPGGGPYGTGGDRPSYQTQRIENFTRYDTQYSDFMYQFAGQRLRMRSDGGYDYRLFGGQGFQFTDRDNLELTFYQQWTRLGGTFGAVKTGVFGTQEINANYSHTFANKITLYGTAIWQGSTFGMTNGSWSNSFGAEAGVRIPF